MLELQGLYMRVRPIATGVVGVSHPALLEAATVSFAARLPKGGPRVRPSRWRAGAALATCTRVFITAFGHRGKME